MAAEIFLDRTRTGLILRVQDAGLEERFEIEPEVVDRFLLEADRLRRQQRLDQIRGLTERQKQYLDWISAYFWQRGRAPSIQEVADHFRVSWNGSIAVIKSLCNKGLLSREPHLKRSMRILV